MIELPLFPAVAELDATASPRQIGRGGFIHNLVYQLESFLTAARLSKLGDEKSIQNRAPRPVEVPFSCQGYPRQWRRCIHEVLDNRFHTKLAVEFV
jgi:hypothetical protein